MTSATDNRTTELRKKLTERGVEYEPTRFSTLQTTFTANGIEWIVTERESTGELFVEPRHGLTPEQAIAVTLGSEREKQLEELVRDAYWLIARAVWTHVSQDKFAADWTERVSVTGIEVD